jgi:hypothetical protein
MRRQTISWRWILGLNVTLAACAVAAPVASLPGPVRMLAAGLMVLILPGVAWLGLFRRQALTPARLALAVTGVSSLATLGAMLVTTLGPEVPSRGLALAWTVLVINSGQILAGRPAALATGPRWNMLATVAGAGFLVTALCALHLVPPLEDHDLELGGSAWGLAADYQPWYLTNRELYVQAAHPVLFHFHISESLLFTGELAATHPSYDAAMRARKAEKNGESFPWMEQWQANYQQFMARPALVGTRAPSCIFSALALALLCQVVIHLTGNLTAGLLAVLLFMSFPETLVRASYAGYFPVTLFATLVLVLIFSARDQEATWAGRSGWMLAGGMFAALVNHKTVVLVLALMALAGMETLLGVLRERDFTPSRWLRRVDPGVVAMAMGFGGGTFMWWTYSWLVHPAAFIEDHMRKHIAHRILLNDFRLGASDQRYAPGMLEVWTEFNAHTGYLFIPVALVAVLLLLVRWLVHPSRHDGLPPATGKFPSLAPALALWFLTGAFLYTVTDWRQTKHLMNQLAPMVVLATALVWPLLDHLQRRTGDGTGTAPGGSSVFINSTALRFSAGLLLLAVLGFNLLADYRLAMDFTSMTISGASAIDGW